MKAWLGEGGGVWKFPPKPNAPGEYGERQDGVLAGYVHFSEYDDEIWIRYVFVAPEYRRQGVATVMYEEIRRQFPGEKITSSGTTDEGGKLRKSLKEKGIAASAESSPFDGLVERHGGMPHLLEDIGMDAGRLDEERLWRDVKMNYDARWPAYKARWEFPLTLYRTVRLEGGIASFRTEDAGVYWAPNEKDAVDYWAFGTMGPNYVCWIVKGQVDEQAVDWELTLLHDILYEEERQVILREGSPIQVLGVKKSGNRQWVKPPWKSITASVTKTAKAMDYGMVVNILHQLMPDVGGDLPTPELKIVNHARLAWLGRCEWVLGNPNTIIKLQKAICSDERTLRRIIAHELCHHEQYLVHWSKWNSGNFKLMVRLEGGHGKTFKEIAERWNAKHGKDFVTEKSDENNILEYDEKPFFVFMNRRIMGNRPTWQASIRITDKQRKFMMRKLQGEYRLVQTTDRRFINAPVIGSPKGWQVIPLENHEWEEAAGRLFSQPDLRMEWTPPPPATEEEQRAREEEQRTQDRAEREKYWDDLKRKSDEFKQKKLQLEESRKANPEWRQGSLNKKAFVRQDLTWLKHYLTMSKPEMGEELARQETGYFLEWLQREYPDIPEGLGIMPPDEAEAGDDFEERMDAFREDFLDRDLFGRVPPDIYDQFLEYGGNWVMQNDPANAPSFMHLTYKGIVKNQWLVHFTDHADDISREGFTKGMWDLSKLGLTTYYTDNAKEAGGYCFAVPADDTGSLRGFDFGKHAVLFRASGLMTYHSGDEFYQVIFWGKDARDIIPIRHNDYSNWELPCGSSGRPVFQAEKIQDAVDWAIENFQQYRSLLVPYQNAGKDRKPRNPLLQPKSVPVAASHKQTQNRENVYRDVGEGEGTEGYANQPECVEGTKALLPLEELLPAIKVGRASDHLLTWEEFVRKHGGIGVILAWYDADPLEYWFPNGGPERDELEKLPIEEQERYCLNRAARDLKRHYDDFVGMHDSRRFPLDIYRMLSLVGGVKAIKPKGIGIYWSWDEGTAEAHWGRFGNGAVEVLLRAQVSENDVDWEGTIIANLDPSLGEDEQEIRLKPGVHPVVLGWKGDDDVWHDPPKKWKAVTAGMTLRVKTAEDSDSNHPLYWNKRNNNVLAALKALSYAADIRLFGSAVKGKEAPGDLDVFLDLRGKDRKHPAWKDLVSIAHKYYGSLDPFIITDDGVMVRNDYATGWIVSKKQNKMVREMLQDGIPIVSVGDFKIPEKQARVAGYPDPGALARRAQFQTGKPVTMRAFHVTEADGRIKWGNGGAFFSPEPAGEYGTHYVQATLSFKNPLVAEDQVDAAQKYASPEVAARVDRLVGDDLPMSAVDPVVGWMNADRMMAEIARAGGYDGIVYTDPGSLTTMEFVALDPPSVTDVSGPQEVMPYLEKKYDKFMKGKTDAA